MVLERQSIWSRVEPVASIPMLAFAQDDVRFHVSEIAPGSRFEAHVAPGEYSQRITTKMADRDDHALMMIAIRLRHSPGLARARRSRRRKKAQRPSDRGLRYCRLRRNFASCSDLLAHWGRSDHRLRRNIRASAAVDDKLRQGIKMCPSATYYLQIGSNSANHTRQRTRRTI